MSWQDHGTTEEQDDEPAMTLGDLRDGDEATITVREEPETFTSDWADPGEEDDALRVPATFHSSDYAYTTEDGEAFEDGDNVTLITWSSRFTAALVSFSEDNGGVVGERVTVQKFGRGYETTYNVVAADE